MPSPWESAENDLKEAAKLVDRANRSVLQGASELERISDEYGLMPRKPLNDTLERATHFSQRLTNLSKNIMACSWLATWDGGETDATRD